MLKPKSFSWLFIAFSLFSLYLISLSSFASFATSNSSLSLGSFNIRNYGGPSTTQSSDQIIADFFKNEDFQIFSVQEITNKNRFQNLIKLARPEMQVIFSKSGGSGSQYLGIIFNPSLFQLEDLQEYSISKDDQANNLRPAFIAILKEHKTSKRLVVTALHLKAGNNPKDLAMRKKQYDKLSSIFNRYKEEGLHNLIILGDFNTAELQNQKAVGDFNNFLNKNNFIDSSRELECTDYFSNGNILRPSRLDHIVLSRELYDSFAKINVQAKGECLKNKCQTINKHNSSSIENSFYQLVSDHCPISTTLLPSL